MKYRACVIPNPFKDSAVALSKEIEKFLLECDCVISNMKQCDFVITVGGDGTVLFEKNRTEKPIFAVGSEISYLCQASEKNWEQILSDIINKGYILEERDMLLSSLNSRVLPPALNEVTVRNKEHRILRLELNVMGSIYTFKADGVIFATPTGSTAYSYSCGGPELDPHADKYVLAPIAAYRRAFLPLIVPINEKSLLKVSTTCEADVVIDGQIVFPLSENNSIEVWKSERKQAFIIPKTEKLLRTFPLSNFMRKHYD
ncbi:MAG: NAD(+)/NADH kinase [Candidatus Micrarchaeia archaeon]